MNQGRDKYIEEQDSLHFTLLSVHSRDLSRRKHNVDLVCQRCKELAGNRESDVLKRYLPVILRLASVCPFEDVRKEFTKLLQDLKVSWNQNSWLAGFSTKWQVREFAKLTLFYYFKGMTSFFLFRQAAKKSQEKFTSDLRRSSLRKRYVKLRKRRRKAWCYWRKLIGTFWNIFLPFTSETSAQKNCQANLIFCNLNASETLSKGIAPMTSALLLLSLLVDMVPKALVQKIRSVQFVAKQ